jgi:hypothetical protein
MSLDNPLWGAPRIHGELLKLGFDVAKSTVAKYMKRHVGPPGQSWWTFLRNHMPEIAAMGPVRGADACLQPALRLQEDSMANEKTTRGRNQDRDRVAGGQEYEVEYFARKHGISAEQARQLIQQHGNNRETLDREAEKLKRSAG